MSHGTVAVLLPDDWAVIDLEDEAARTTAVDTLVEQQLGSSPELASLRAALRADLRRSTEQAARAGGNLMALAVGSGGLPTVPASVTVYRVPGSLDARGRAAMTSVLASDEPGHSLDIGDGMAGTVLRRIRPAAARSALTGDHELPALVADYWVEVAPGAQLLYLVFSSPLVEHRDELARLFDTVVSSVRVLATNTSRTTHTTTQEDM